MSGAVRVDGKTADKAGACFAEDADITVEGDDLPYVSTVSYTHLDVYKRQALQYPRAGRESWRSKAIAANEERNMPERKSHAPKGLSHACCR